MFSGDETVGRDGLATPLKTQSGILTLGVFLLIIQFFIGF
jgi:hypothetical protein